MSYVQIAITAVLFISLYFPIFAPLGQEWMGESQNYSHGFLIPLISLYFLWHKREELKCSVIAPSPAGILVILAGLVLYLVATAGFQTFFQGISMLIVLLGIVYAQAGRELLKKTAFSITYLVLMIPMPTVVFNTIAFHLRMFIAKPVYGILKLTGMNVTALGNVIHLPTCSIVVASECSGFRGVTLFTTVSLAIGYLLHKSIAKRVFLFGFGLALAFVMNVLRIVSIALTINIMKLDRVLTAVDQTAGYVAWFTGILILFGVSHLMGEDK